MFKKIFDEIKDRAIEQAKEIAAEKANDLISQGKEYADEKVNHYLGTKKKEVEQEESPSKSGQRYEGVIEPEIIPSSNELNYQDADAFEKKLQNGLSDLCKNFATGNPEEALEAMNKLTEMAGEVAKFTEVQKTKRKEIEAQRDIIVEQIKSKKEIILYTLERTFDERKDNFRKLFDVIDDALAKNNIQQLQLGLSSMNHLAALSPFKSLESIESTQKALGDKDHTWNF